MISLTNEVLELTEFDEDCLKLRIKEIQVPEPTVLLFVFPDGSIVKKIWSYKSRSESWSDKARLKARESSLKKLERRS